MAFRAMENLSRHQKLIIAFSEDGLNGMSQTFHKLLPYKTWLEDTGEIKERPILINNWEATYFDFNEDTISRDCKISKRSWN